jgi:RecA-family ATPase
MSEFMGNGGNVHMSAEEWASLGVMQHANGLDDATASAEPAADQDPLHGLEFPHGISLETNSNDMIEGVIGPGELVVVYGASGVGKTFIVLHMALRLALGLFIGGRETRPAAVLYVGYEGERGLQKRILAAMDKYGDPYRRFARLTPSVPLDSSENGRQGSAVICDAVQRLRAVSGCENVVVIIDTLSRAIAGDDENTAQSMSVFVERRAGEITKQTGAAVVFVRWSRLSKQQIRVATWIVCRD